MSKADELQKAILNNIPDQAWLKDRDSRYILVNDACIAACRLPENKIIGKTPADIWPAEWGREYIDTDRRVMEQGERLRYEEQRHAEDGSLRWYDTIKTPIRNEAGDVIGTTGILWHNRGALFSLKPDHLNVLQAGKRPFHTLNPGMYLKNDKPHILYGTQGADGQPQTLTTILARMIDYGMDPLTALSRPRFLLGKTFSDTRNSLTLEKDAGKQVFQELAKRGHEMSVISPQSPLSGHPGAIVIDQKTGIFSGAHDPRSDG